MGGCGSVCRGGGGKGMNVSGGSVCLSECKGGGK